MASSGPARLECWASTHPGLEAVLASELEGLGLDHGAPEPGGVPFSTDAVGVMRANLHLRTAGKVLVRLGSFAARGFPELERKAAGVPWDRFLEPGHPVAFRVTAKRSRLNHRRAIAERLVRISGGVEAAGESGSGGPPPREFVVRVFRDRFTISADSSGALLHRRGYREAGGKAPLRETLAAGMLLASGWDPEGPLLDPFCGSGTLPIEAAMIAMGIAPGLRRDFAFQGWPGFDGSVWRALREEAEARTRPRPPAAIVGSDRDAGVVESARANALRAGVAGGVEFVHRALSHVEAPPGGPGWVVANPPYGRRVGDPGALRDLYAALGRVCRRALPGWRVVLLSADRALEGQVGLDFRTVLRTENGGLSVRVVAARVPADGQVRAR